MQRNSFFFLAENGMMLLQIKRKDMISGMVYFERDLIAERNKKAEIKKSVIKRWNVNYVDQEALKQKEEEEAKLREAQEIFERLEREKAADEAEKQAEINKAYKEAELDAQKWLDDNYNETTGSCSGMYGQGKVDEVNKDQIAMILNEQNAALRGSIDTEKAD